MKKTFLKSAMIALVGVGLMAGGAMASPILTLTGSEGGTVTVTDADNDGIVTYAGIVDGWDFTTATGVSSPPLGAPTMPSMHLDGVVTSGAINESSSIQFSLRDTFDSFAGTGWDVGVSVNADDGSNVTYDVLLNGTSIASSGPIYDLGVFSAISNSIPTGSYTLEMVGTITHDNVDSTSSFNASVDSTGSGTNPVPEPATMLLFGTGLAALGGYRKRQAKKK